jgi:hypothetical protein
MEWLSIALGAIGALSICAFILGIVSIFKVGALDDRNEGENEGK